jgi:hypothetical protein
LREGANKYLWKLVMAKTSTSTLEFINEIFPTEASLVAVDPLLGKLRNKIRHVDAEILAAVRQQSTSGSKAKDDLAAAMRAIQVTWPLHSECLM